jgi:signal peptidase I
MGLLVRAAIHIYSIPSESMAPTLAVGDQIVVTRYFGGMPERGDVVVFRSPADNEVMVKRVIGLPGDLVDSRLGRVRIGGHTIPEPYVLRQAATGAIDPQVVPQESYYVLGDNRDDSLDSRSWGVVPRSMIVGRARLILWSSPPDARDAAHASTTDSGVDASDFASGPRLFKWVR